MIHAISYHHIDALDYLRPGVSYTIMAGETQAEVHGWPEDVTFPTVAELDAALVAMQQQVATTKKAKQDYRATIMADAHSAVGLPFSKFSNRQLLAVLSLAFEREGILGADGNLRPLAEWVLPV